MNKKQIELLSVFGIAKKSDSQFREYIENQYGPQIADIFVKFKDDPDELSKALRSLENDPLFDDKVGLLNAQMNQQQIIDYALPSIDGELKFFTRKYRFIELFRSNITTFGPFNCNSKT